MAALAIVLAIRRRRTPEVLVLDVALAGHHEESGFSITIPAGWALQPSAWVMHNRKVAFGKDSPISQRASLPFLAATRYVDTVDTVNPTIQVMFRPNPGPQLSAVQIMHKLLPMVLGMFPECRYDEEIAETTLGGVSAGVAQLRYTLPVGDKAYDVRARYWIVNCGANMLMMNCAGPTEGEDEAFAQFQEMVDSVNFEKPKFGGV